MPQLDGSPPDRLLCLTFTRAAAAEMTARLFKRLGTWALVSEETLAEDLTSLIGAPASPKLRNRARRLFAEQVAFVVATREPGGEFGGLPELAVGGWVTVTPGSCWPR